MAARSAAFDLDAAGATVDGIELFTVSLTAETDMQMFDDASVPDPAWTFTDGCGHFHAWDDAGELPTLSLRRVQVPCDGSCGGCCDEDGYTTTVYECVICSERVYPARKLGMRTTTGPTCYTAVVRGPGDLINTQNRMVSFTCAAGFGVGNLTVSEVHSSGDGATVVHASIGLTGLFRRNGTQAQRQQHIPRANLARAVLAGAEAVRKPWETLSTQEREEFLNDFATLAASRAITAALPHRGLDADGEVLP